MPDQLAALFVFALVATGSPGGATTLATASGARFGYRGSVPLILGIALALAGLMAVSGTGLAAVFQASPSLEIIVKAAGSVYLIWLAIKIGLAGPPVPARIVQDRPTRLLGGAVLLLMNPKAWAMAVGVSSSFSELYADPWLLGGFLASVFALCASISLSIWALIGGFVARWLKSDIHWHLFNGCMAGLLVASILQLWI